MPNDYAPGNAAFTEGLASLLDHLRSHPEATIEKARELRNQLSGPPNASTGRVIDNHGRFFDLLRELDGDPEPLPLETPAGPLDRVPRFLLFRRADRIVMAIVPEDASVHPPSLRRTNDPECPATLLSEQEVRTLGFTPGQVHPAFLDPAFLDPTAPENRVCVSQIIIDATLLAHAIIAPKSSVLTPGQTANQPMRVRTAIDAWVEALFRMHGTRKVFFANVTTATRCDDLLLKLLESQPIHTRFAPTPWGVSTSATCGRPWCPTWLR